jgi:hypothetical protein
MNAVIWIIILALFVLWLVGLAVNWGSWLWIFFIVAVILLLFNIFTGRSVET